MPIIKPFNGQWPTIHPTAFIAENAVIVGNVTVGAQASIWYNCVLRGDVAPIVIGERSNIQDGTVIHVASETLGGQERGTIVGHSVTVGHMALLHACTLEDACFVGMKACIMDGATVKTGAMVGAGSLVTARKQLETGQLYTGNPATAKRALTPSETAFIQTSADFYVNLASQHA
jgi:gamma-carbonic anhydrase